MKGEREREKEADRLCGDARWRLYLSGGNRRRRREAGQRLALLSARHVENQRQPSE